MGWVRNRTIRCPGVSLLHRQARVASVARVRRGSHRAAARAGGKPRRYALAYWLLLLLVPPLLVGRLPGTDAARAASPARVATLQSPRPPAAATTFVWSVRGLATRAGQQHIMSLYLSGCWAARQIARVTATSRPLRVRVDAHTGAIIVDGLHNPVRPLTITVRFKTRLRSAPTGAHLVLRWGAARNAIVTLPAGGPACRAVPTLTSPIPPSSSTTFVWSLVGLEARAHAALVDLVGCWSARQVARATSKARSVQIHVDRKTGVITIAHNRGADLPAAITVTFKSKLHSAPAGSHLLVRLQARKTATATFAVGGPACPEQQRVTRRPTPTARARATLRPTAARTPTSTAIATTKDPSTPTATAPPTATATPTPRPAGTIPPTPMAALVPTPTPTAAPTSTPAPTNTPPPAPLPPTATNTAAPMATPTSTAWSDPSDPVVMAAGDIACDPSDPSYHNGIGIGTSCMQRATSNELTTTVAILPLGDDQYSSGTLTQFDTAYDPTWGRYKSTTYPAPGNHEYQTSGAAGYYSYFGSAASPQDTNCTAGCKGYYSYDLGAWHLVVLNSECAQVGGCAAGSPQEQWLHADLAAHSNMCTLAYWHRPLFTTGTSLGDSAVDDFWEDLYNAHADLVLNGHDHDYERFAPQDPSGASDPTTGLTEIIVGTGGKDHGSFNSTASNSVVRDNTTYGVLKLTLHPTSFDWQFLPATASGNGTFTDAGSHVCH